MTDTTTAASSGGVAARLARPNILSLQPYHCARDDYTTGILLDANENSFGPPIHQQTTISSNGNGSSNGDVDKKSVTPSIELERYPDPYQIPLKEKVAAYRGHGIRPAHIFVGVGSDEAIDLLMRIFCKPGHDKILTTPPTYGMYKVCAKVNDVDIVNMPLTPEFDVQIAETLKAITPQVKLLFLCSPGNPTSKAIPLADIKAIAGSAEAQNCIVVIDEAYVDFSTQGTAVSLVNTYPNLVVLQTLSKAFGLAAIRCGFCIGAPDIIQLMNNVKAPYNVNALTSQLALAAMDSTANVQTHVDAILEQRTVVAAALNGLECVTHVYPSDANFVLFRLQSHAQAVYKSMADHGVVTRYRGTELHCDECIRVTIGTAEQNQAFLAALKETHASLTQSS